MSSTSAYRISTRRDELDVPLIHRFLSQESYWASNVPLEVVERALEHSLCFGLFESRQQIGFARVVTDSATFGYLADVFILDPYRGRGLGRQLMAAVMAHPQLQGLRRFMLATRDAHELYRRFGFTAPRHPEVLMERHDPDLYLKG